MTNFAGLKHVSVSNNLLLTATECVGRKTRPGPHLVTSKWRGNRERKKGKKKAAAQASLGHFSQSKIRIDICLSGIECGAVLQHIPGTDTSSKRLATVMNVIMIEHIGEPAFAA